MSNVPIYLPYIHRPIIVRERTPGILSSHREDDSHNVREGWVVHLQDARWVLQSLVEERTRDGCIG